jgi:hypothetical protein
MGNFPKASGKGWPGGLENPFLPLSAFLDPGVLPGASAWGCLFNRKTLILYFAELRLNVTRIPFWKGAKIKKC